MGSVEFFTISTNGEKKTRVTKFYGKLNAIKLSTSAFQILV